jgi:hypothetical protein
LPGGDAGALEPAREDATLAEPDRRIYASRCPGQASLLSHYATHRSQVGA